MLKKKIEAIIILKKNITKIVKKKLIKINNYLLVRMVSLHFLF